MRVDISNIRVSITRFPSISTDRSLLEPWIQSTAVHIMNDACHNYTSIPEIASSIAKKMLDHIEDASGLHLQVVLPMSGYPTQFKSRLNFAHLQVWATKPEGVDPNHARFSSVSDWELRIAQESSEAARKYHVTITVALKEPSMDPDHAAWKHSYEGEAANTTTVLPEVRSGGKEIFPYSEAHQAVADFLESKAHTNFDVMALQASHIAFEALARSKTRFRPQRLRIRVKERVLAIPGKASAAIMKSWHFEGRQHKKYRNVQEDVKLEPGSQQAVVALGSNVGNRIGMIEEACNEMTRRGLEILQTSSLYETEAMYKTDQRSFVNGVCKVCYGACNVIHGRKY